MSCFFKMSSMSTREDIGSNLDIIIKPIGKLLYRVKLLKTGSFPVKDKQRFLAKGFFLKNDIILLNFLYIINFSKNLLKILEI